MRELWNALGKAFEGGWETGAPFAGASVGRGLFSNPTLTERDRDVRDLKAHYARFLTAYSASILSNRDALEHAVIVAAYDAGVRAAPSDTAWIIDAAYACGCALLENEFLAIPDINDGDWAHLTLGALFSLRRDLQRFDRLLAKPTETRDLAQRVVEILIQNLLAATPDIPSECGTGALQFDAALPDFIHDPADSVEGAIKLLFADALVQVGLFDGVRARLEYNVYLASGLNPADPDARSKRLVLPTACKNKSPRDLIGDYLGGTPIASLYETRIPVQIPSATRFEHCHILGGTGHGKSQLLLKLIHHDLAENTERPALIVIDSQGDLVRTLSRLALFDPEAPDSLADRLVLIDPNDVEYPASLNLFDVSRERLSAYGPADRERLQNGVVETFEQMFGALLGAELTQKQGVVFRFLARLLLQIPDATIHTLLEIMEQGAKYRPYMAQLGGAARHFFEREFFDPSFSQTKKQIAKRLWGVLANPVFERMFTHPKNKLDLFSTMNTGKIVLVNTAKDLLKTEGSSLFGRFLIGQIAQAASERAIIPENERRPVFVYLDEAQDYLDESIAALVNQARKYKVGLTFAHQNLDQLTPSLRASVLASTSIKFAGGVSAKDARALAEDMRTDPDMLTSTRKRRGETEFACFVKNRTARALRVSVPLGAVQMLPTLSDEEYGVLIDRNRAQYAEPAAALRVAVAARAPTAPVAMEAAPVAPPASVPVSPSQEEDVAVQSPATSSPPTPPTRTKRAAPDPYVAGQGGKEHKYLQHLLREAAQERGFKADVEFQVEGGSVDLAVVAGAVKIACEINVTTDIEYELGNARKCLAAGFDQVWLIATNEKRRKALAKQIIPKLASIDQAKLSVLAPDEAIARLNETGAQTTTESTVRGYSVKVRRVESDPETARQIRERVAGIIAKSTRTLKEGS